MNAAELVRLIDAYAAGMGSLGAASNEPDDVWVRAFDRTVDDRKALTKYIAEHVK